MRTLVAWLARRATILLAAGVFVGLALPGAAAVLRPLLMPLVWGLLLIAMLRIDWADVAHYARRPGLPLAVIGWMLLVSPVLMTGLVAALEPSPGLATALVLVAAVAPLVSSPALAVFLGLDGALALFVLVVATLATPLVLPLTAVAILGLPLEVSPVYLMLRLAGFIGSTVAAAALLRHWIGRRRLAASAPVLDVLALAMLIMFAVAIMDGVAARLSADPAWVLTVAGAAFAVNLGLNLVSVAAFAWSGWARALTAGFVCGNRNLAIVLAVLPAGVHPDVFLYFALAQFPIYILPALLAPVYRALLRRADRSPGEKCELV